MFRCRASAICVAFFFFFSSRRRHTRFDCDWSSDVCSSDLPARPAGSPPNLFAGRGEYALRSRHRAYPRSEERRVGKRVDLGGRRIIKKKKNKKIKMKNKVQTNSIITKSE